MARRSGWIWSIRARMVGLALVSIAPLVVIYALQANDLQAQGRADAAADTLRLGRILAEREAADLERTRAVLVAASGLADQAWTGEGCAAALANLQEQIPGASNVLTLSPEGDVLCSSVPLSGPLNLADRLYVQDAIETGEFAAEVEPAGPLTPATAMVATVPVNKGGVGMVAAVTGIGEGLDTFVDRVGLPPGATASIIDDTGRMLASTSPEDLQSPKLGIQPIVDQVVAGSGEGTVTADGADGVSRVYSYADIAGTNQTAFALVGIPKSVAFATADRERRTNLIAGGIIGLLAVIVALVIGELSVARPVHAIVQTVRRLGRGNLDARTGDKVSAGEIGELAQSIDEMAGDLQERDDSLREAAGERERLLNDLLSAQEVERARIAADIHDDTIQTMIAAALETQLLRRDLDGPEAEQQGRRVEQTIQEAVGRLRHLMFELEPPSSETGLEEGIEIYLEGVLTATPTAIVVDVDGATEPTGAARHVLYRNIREAAINAARHGGAETIRVALRPADEGLAVSVADDGSGFDATTSPPADHHGLRTMRERTESLGGRFSIDSTVGQGTTVHFWLPDR